MDVRLVGEIMFVAKTIWQVLVGHSLASGAHTLDTW